MMPAQQCFKAVDLVRFNRILHLVMDVELIVFDCRAQIVCQTAPCPNVVIHGLIIITHMAGEIFLGPVHGQISIVDQCLSR